MAMYQDRIFAFTPKGALHQLPKGSTPVDLAYAVHTDLGDRAVGQRSTGGMFLFARCSTMAIWAKY